MIGKGQVGEKLDAALMASLESAGAALAGAGAAAGALAGAFSQLTGTIAPFVQAFSPSTVEMFNAALNDLAAVVGVALAPVLGVATDIVREFSAALLPVMQELQPAFRQVAEVVASVLIPVLDNVMAVFQALVPLVKLAADVFAALAPILRVQSVLAAGLAEVFKSLMESLFGDGEGLKGAMGEFARAVQELAKWSVMLAGYFAKLVDKSDRFITGMIKGLEGRAAEKKDATGTGAAKGS